MVPHRARDECAADPDLGGPRRCVAEGPRDLVTRSTTHRRAPSSCRDALLPTIHALDKDQLTVSPAPAPVAGRTVQPWCRENTHPARRCARRGFLRRRAHPRKAEAVLLSSLPDLLGFDDGAYRRCRAASDVQGRETPGTLDLVAGGLPGHLQVAVKDHPHPGRPDRVADPDEAAARVDRKRPATGGDAAVDRVPAAPGLGQPEVVDGHVLRDREAVMGLDAVQGEDILDPGPGKGVGDRAANMREDVVSMGAGIELVLQAQEGAAVTPARDPRDRSPKKSAPVLTHPSVGDQHDTGPTIGDLAAVITPHPPDHRRVRLVVGGEALRRGRPPAGRRPGCGLGVGDVRSGDAVQMLITQAITPVVLLGDLREGIRPDKVLPPSLVPDPRSRRRVTRTISPRHVSLNPHPESQGDVITARLKISHRCHDRHTPRRTGRLMAGRGNTGQLRDHAGHHGTQMALLDVELPHRVTDMNDLNLVSGDSGVRQSAGGGLPHEVADLQRLLGEVTGKVTLVPANDPDGLLHGHVSVLLVWGSVHVRAGIAEMRSGSVAARTPASVTPGAHSTSTRPWSVTSRTARSVMMRWTTRSPVSGKEHSLTILKSPFLATCSIRMMTLRAPWTRSMAPPMPLIIVPGIVQLARSPVAETCIAPRIAALIMSGSWSPSKGYGPVPRMPFSDCSTSSTSASRKLGTRVGSPMPRLT